MKGFKKSWILTEEGLVKTDLKVEMGMIASIGEENEAGYQLPDHLLVVPGFIDEHIHGAGGSDAMDGTVEDIGIIAQNLATEGTTGFLATTMTQSPDNIIKALTAVKDYKEANHHLGAEVLGVHLEGPFIATEFIGAQPLEYVVKPDIKVFEQYQVASGNNIKIVSLAPEVEGAIELIEYLNANNIKASIGHSNSTYQDVKRALAAGACNITHTYNAMKPLHHREIGTVGSALLLDDLYSEVICDGIHVSVPALALLYKSKPEGKMLLITDAMRAKNLPDGVSELGGQTVIVKDGEARLENGVLAGSVLKMNVAVANLKKFLNLSLKDAIRCATINPAKSLGVDNLLGSIKVGKRADFVIIDADVNVYATIRNGVIIFQKQ